MSWNHQTGETEKQTVNNKMNEQTVNSKTIAALHRNENVATALAEKLNERMTGANFVTISKLSERPLGKSIGSLGFPQHIG